MPWTFAKREGLLIVAGIVKVMQLTCLLWIYPGHGATLLRGSNTWNATEKLLERLSHLQTKKQHQRFFFGLIFTSSPTPAAFISGFKSYVATFGEGTIDLVSPSNCFSTPPLKKKVTCAYFSVSMDATKPSEEKKRTALHIFYVNEMPGCKKEQPNCKDRHKLWVLMLNHAHNWPMTGRYGPLKIIPYPLTFYGLNLFLDRHRHYYV